MSLRTPVTFVPAGITAWVDSGETVLDAARAAGVLISAPCGGRGVCGKCAVKVLDGDLMPPDEQEKRGLAVAPPGIRLSCRARVDSPVTIRPLVATGVSSTAGEDPVQDDLFVAAVDLGTSTVSAVIVGGVSGRELGRAVAANRQQAYGADVVSRIAHAMSGGASDLHAAAIASVLEVLEEACGHAGACFDRITRVVFAGNTAMMALLINAEIAPLAAAPFSLPSGISGEFSSTELSVALERATFSAISPLGAMVGGDILAGMFAAGIIAAEDDCMFIDIGTNAEMVVRWKRRLLFASAAAGPAFEGWGLSCGGPAVDGAIVSLDYESDILTPIVIGGEAPTWLSGSGLVSVVALLLSVGHLDAQGAMQQSGPLASLFDRDENGVLRVNVGTTEAPVFLSQLDVRAFQTAKAAIAAGILVLSKYSRLKPKRLKRFVITGGFGSALSVEDLVNTGVIPEEMIDRVVVVNDAALLGAASVALDMTLEGDIEGFSEKAEHIELASEQSFTDGFVPATALRRFTMRKGFS